MLKYAGRIVREAARRPHAASKRLSQLKWAAEYNGLNTRILADVSRAIRKLMAAAGTTKAQPMPERTMSKLLSKLLMQERLLAALAWLAWVTSSRLDDITKLVQEAFHRRRGFLTIDFRFTKANPTAAPREDHATAIDLKWVPRFVLDAIKEWPPRQRDRDNAKNRLYRALRKFEVERPRVARPGVKWRPSYSLHSIKLGAGQVMLQAAASGQLPTALISLMMKHKRSQPILEATTVGYLADTLRTAQATGITKATELLASRLAATIPTLLHAAPPSKRSTATSSHGSKQSKPRRT